MQEHKQLRSRQQLSSRQQQGSRSKRDGLHVRILPEPKLVLTQLGSTLQQGRRLLLSSRLQLWRT